MHRLWSVVATLVVAGITSASAQGPSTDHTASGKSDTDIRVGVYVNIRPDCTSGPLPSIKRTSPPENGKVTVKRGKGDSNECQAMLGSRGASVHCGLSLARGFCGRRCSHVGSHVSRRQDGSAAV